MRAVLLLAVVALGLGGVIAWELQHFGADAPTSLPRVTPAAPAPAVAATAGRPLAQWADTVLARPLFSPTRRPPAAAPAASPAVAVALPRLTGVLISPTGRTAIFAGAERPVAVNEGGMVNGYLVRSIQPGRVVLAGPGGDQLVRPTYDAGRPPPSLPGPRLAPAAPPGPSLVLPDSAQSAMPFDQNPTPTGADILRNLGRTATPPR